MNFNAAPLDVIVGIYHPFRDHVWNGLTAGVPFKNSLLSDIPAVIMPWKELGIDLWLQGIIPLWNPFVGTGLPLAANFQSGIFYPFNLVFILLTKIMGIHGFLSAWNIYILSIPVLTAYFSYLFLRQKKVGVEGAVFAGIAFSLSTSMIGWLEYGNMGHSILWLPLMLYFADKIINENRLNFLPLLSISLALSILAGYPQLSIFSLITLALFSFFAIIIDIKQNKKRLKLAGLITTAVIIGIGLSSVQILPSVELLKYSARSSDPFIISQNYGFLQVKHLLTLFAPDLFGNPASGNYFGGLTYNDFGLYVGIITLLFAFLAPLFQRERGVRFFILMALLSLFLSLENPLSRLVYTMRLPGLSGSIASRWLFIFDFSLCMLGGYGLDQIIKNKDKKGIFKKCFLVFSVFFLILIFIWLIVFAQNLSVSKRNLILPSIIFLASSLTLFLYLTKIVPEKFKKIFPILIILLVSFELVRQAVKFNPFSPKEYFFPKTEVTDFLIKNTEKQRIIGSIPASMNMPYRLYSPEAYEPMLLERFSQFISIINGTKPTTGTKFGIIENYQSKLIDLLAVKYVVYNPEDFRTNFYPPNPDFPKDRFKKVFQYGKTSVYENKNVLPRAFLVGDYVSETDPQKIAGLLLAKDFNLRKSVILERDINIPKNPCDGLSEIKDYKANKINIFVNSPSTCLLFLSDNYYPGWIAKVNGEETEIMRANFTFRAVKVPQGEHIVNFEYQPDSFKIGLYLTAASSVILLLFAVLVRKK